MSAINTQHLTTLTNRSVTGENGGTPALDLVYCLCEALEAEGVTYCHWKSNAALDRSARGDNDLDLLVSRAHGYRFAEIVHRLGLKQAVDNSVERLPGVLSYYGHDRKSGKLVHVHTHYQLVLGQDRTKNYRLPLEEPYLASAVRRGLFRVPAPEFEFVVFIIRMVIKHSIWDAVLSWQGSLSKTEQQELDYLQSLVNPNEIQALLASHMPWIDVCLFNQAVQTLRPGCAHRTRLRVAHRLQRMLIAQSRQSPVVDVAAKLWRRLMLAARRRLFRNPPRKTLVHGGALIAVVGGDGAGKSTAIQGLHSWLATELHVSRMHLGKPPRSWNTLAIDALLKLERWFRGTRGLSLKTVLASSSPLRYVHLIRVVCTARDRYRLYLKTRRAATNGSIVICDRYPLSSLKMTDGPVLDQVIDGRASDWFIRWLQRMESHYYQQIMLPDLLIVLRVEPEVAVLRRSNEDAAWIRARCQEIWDADWQQTSAHVVDASRSKGEVLLEIKSLVWAHL